MVRVLLTDSISKSYTGGVSEFEIFVSNVRQLIRQLDEKYPGLGSETVSYTHLTLPTKP